MNHDDAAPSIIMDARGYYWRNYPEHLSMVPTTDDNEPTPRPYVLYWDVGTVSEDGTFTQNGDVCRLPTQGEAAEWLASYFSDSIESDMEGYLEDAEKLRTWLRGLSGSL